MFDIVPEPSNQKAPAEKPETEEKAAPAGNIEGIFEEGTDTSNSPKNDGMRLWTDDTGQYRIRGRLAIIGEDSIQILKENGRYTTVPLSRLSSADVQFIKQQTQLTATQQTADSSQF